MIFDGCRWRRSHGKAVAVTLPRENQSQRHKDKNREYYSVFGRRCDPGAEGAVLTKWKTWSEQPIYAKIVEGDYGLTNMLYGEDGYAYLYYKGWVYVRRCRK